MSAGESEDRKLERRNIFNRKKQTKKSQVSEEFRAQKKINNEIKQKKLRMIEEELWEDWENN
jgi:hypothetical protein